VFTFCPMIFASGAGVVRLRTGGEDVGREGFSVARIRALVQWTVEFLLAELYPALGAAQNQASGRQTPPGSTAPVGPTGRSTGGTATSFWWVILAVLAVIFLWSVVRARRRVRR
jgi:hypothetical protein